MAVKKNPLDAGIFGMLLNTVSAEKDAILSGEQSWRKDALRDELPDGTLIDTSLGFDTALWETGVKPSGGKWIIVEQYSALREDAERGHKKWVSELTKNPSMELKDVFWSEAFGDESE